MECHGELPGINSRVIDLTLVSLKVNKLQLCGINVDTSQNRVLVFVKNWKQQLVSFISTFYMLKKLM